VDIADDVEGAVVVPFVVPQRNTLDRRRIDRLGRIEDVDVPEALAPQPAQPTTKLALLTANHMRPETAIGTRLVPLHADPLSQAEHDRHGEDVVPACELDQRPPSLGLHVRGVDDREPAAGQPLPDDVVEELERIVGGVLRVLVVGDEAAAEVGRDHLGREEVRMPEGGLARSGDADQDDERKLGDLERFAHVAVNTAIWVGAPSSGSSGPTGRNRTV
jgi:hypothetical protein